jgi:6,7-dimethyl-8-ribityllumazine synthase
MVKKLEGRLSAEGLRFALVTSRFNAFLTDKLVEGALDCLRRHGAADENVTELRVPGSFEIPYIAKRAAESGRYDAVICLGAVIRGGTPHFDFIAAEAAKGVAQVGLQTGVPTIFGVITTDSIEQAIERSGSKGGNKGWDAALGAIELVNLGRELEH